ncbi:membrane protein [Bordetella ansorpii]|uniref:Membrane protein n=1 Tax=Bordetella ansorpii TaxID=288768 RepID=A0A157SQF3_9BORD|nr:TonB family protein [Bordetella ansorpii]SAI72728.1 membrane protein [Bordetella ansorpii]
MQSSAPPSSSGRVRQWPSAPARHYLLVGVAISLLVHAAVLAWRFGPGASARAPVQSLEVVLVNAKTETAPVHAQALAQQQIDGGGEAARGIAQSPLPRTGESAQTIVLQAMRQRQLQLEAEQNRLLTQLESPQRTGAERQAVHPWPDAPESGDDTAQQPGVIQNARIAALSERIREYNSRPRRAYVAPSAAQSRYAAYLDGWSRRIESVGTQHYPEDARGRIYGTLRITVTVRADGSLAGFDIDQPSPHAVLNQAARRIVQMAAPFAPFPPELARDIDELVITRTWHFVNDTLETAGP